MTDAVEPKPRSDSRKKSIITEIGLEEAGPTVWADRPAHDDHAPTIDAPQIEFTDFSVVTEVHQVPEAEASLDADATHLDPPGSSRKGRARCPLCARVYDAEMTRCPEDGSALYPVTIVIRAADLVFPTAPSEGAGSAAVRGAVTLSGTILDGRYVVKKHLESGGMCDVYVGEQRNVDREVAIKIMRKSASKDLIARFETEAKIISSLRHPNTLKLIDYGRTTDGRLYIVTELLSGRSLKKALEAGPMGAQRTLHLIREVCLALEEAHARGIIHRDLNPANIFIEQVGDQEHVKVLDFGIAKVSVTSSLPARAVGPTATAMGMVMGTPAYMSPEQAIGGEVDARSDLYALGVIAFQCITGKLPFAGDALALIRAHASNLAPSIRQARPDLRIDPKLEDLVMRLLAKQPEQRLPTARALANACEALIGTEAVVRAFPRRDETIRVARRARQPHPITSRLAILAITIAFGALVGIALAELGAIPAMAQLFNLGR
jgi:protein kinase-like protein